MLGQMGSIYNHEILWEPVVWILLEETWMAVHLKLEDLCADVRFMLSERESRPKDLSVHLRQMGFHL